MHYVKLGGLVNAAGFVALVLMHVPAASADVQVPVTPEAMSQAQEECRTKPYSMLVTIRNVRDSKGIITVDLQGNNPAIFLKSGGRIGRVRVPAVKGGTQACLPVEHPGIYAVAIYQDKNVNFVLDKGFLGIPSEPYGVSNDPPIYFGPPKFADSAVEVHGPLTPVTITLRN